MIPIIDILTALMKKILPSTLLFLATSSILLPQEETYNRITDGLWDKPTQWTPNRVPNDEQIQVTLNNTDPDPLSELLSNNQKWSEQLRKTEPDFFEKLARQQAPKYLWIGCSDSRVPANDIVGLQPGELFVHRNVANLVYPSDLNCLSVVEYAVNVLKVRHIIVVGHYQCGGVKAAMENTSHSLIDNWLAKIKDIYVRYQKDVDSLPTPEMRLDRMCELNVIEQMRTLSYTTIVQDAWTRNQELSIHGWVYRLKDGRVNVMPLCIDGLEQVAAPYRFLRKSE